MHKDWTSLLKFRLPAYIWAALIATLSSLPVTAPLLKEISLADKLAHLLVYTIFGFLLIRALRNSCIDFSWRRVTFLAILIGSLYGALDEWHQGFLPFRHAEFGDFIMDAIGAVGGSIIYLFSMIHRVEAWQR